MVRIVVVLLFFSAVVTSGGATKCRGLALEGGGSHGAYEAGAIKAFADIITPISEMEYDIITGVSAGALNAFGLSLWPKGQETEMADFLYEVWMNITDSSVFTVNKPLTYSVLFSKSVLNNDPLRETVQHLYDMQGPLARNITIGTTNYDKGEF
jgi:NTE family protein